MSLLSPRDFNPYGGVKFIHVIRRNRWFHPWGKIVSLFPSPNFSLGFLLYQIVKMLWRIDVSWISSHRVSALWVLKRGSR